MSYVSPCRSSSTYRSWAAMWQRCLCEQPGDYRWDNYGGRGITIDPRWDDFNTFLSDMGERPVGKTLDRIRNASGYSKDNCQWASHQEQANNRRNNTRLAFQGETLTISQWASRLGLKPVTLGARLRRGLPLSRALSPPFYKQRKNETSN